MIITDTLKKLEQVNALMEKKGFILIGDETLEEYASGWGTSEYNKYYWGDLLYVKHYGKDAQHTLFITIGTTSKLSRLRGKFYISHLDVVEAQLKLEDFIYLEGKDYKEDREHIGSAWRYRLEAESNVKSLKKALNRISSYTEN